MKQNLKALLIKTSFDKRVKILGNDDILFDGLTIDSRKVQSGFVFAALKGTKVDGHHHIEDAIEKGATIIICEHVPQKQEQQVCYILTNYVADLFASLAFAFYDIDPALKVVGVTGTNGKTSIATILFQMASKLGVKCGLISTVENKIGSEVIPSTHTTPDAEGLAQLMSTMQKAACEIIFMEVSSHALDQGRVSAVPFKVAVFTNITRDHLDYHGTFINYINAKKKFFDMLPKTAVAITNKDDKNGAKMVESCQAHIKYYGLKSMADYKAKLISTGIEGLHLIIDQVEFYSPMVGLFNAYNLLAVYAVAIELGFEKNQILTALSTIHGAEGRMERVENRKVSIIGFVDYAHTPDALENVLSTIKKSKNDYQSIITIIGCGGDRDKGKRPIMAEVAVAQSDKVIFTSDNPRSEDPETILQEMLQGVKSEDQGKVLSIVDRRQAIKTAVMLAQKGDVILLAGKGHEKYQEINGEKLPFEDKKELETALLSKS
ncbi:MAG TPA: UDP-N-acetylmuramoyl-L-alanyl-D-glutamate--2,6-diaminopimelate ligase [Saprospiraceae bacterium]|nr:UDP-N-acetylmuramoyl-L-alanyl-D-glutamate--2,6-diaminopimelate ligase [Saprospiraceae bacterium]